MNEKIIVELSNKLDEANDIYKLSNSVNEINNELDKTYKQCTKSIFDYKFSRYLYYNYIILNKTKVELSKELNIPESTIYYYIRKYNIKKSKELVDKKRLETLKKTCNYYYGVDHPGQLLEAHQKRLEVINEKTNGNYSKETYKALNRSKATRNKMKKSQKARWKRERKLNGLK